MWFLEHESLFGGKRVWLRPGSQQLFGRTKPTDVDSSEGKKVFIDHKNVSRKHMMIKVLEVPADAGTKLHTRSQVEVIDLSCRQGVTVDSQSLLKSTKEVDGSIKYAKTILTGKEHLIKLSYSYPPFKIVWRDYVFTTAVKEKKENTTATHRTAGLHAIGIKTTSEFIFGKTTHVVSQKRNLPKVLQGLVSSIPIVTTDFLDAVLQVAVHSLDANENYVPSQLEEDFDAFWPKEREYIPPAGAEPVARPENMLEPDPARSEVFSGLTFVFLDENQHSNLHQVVAGGGGKALLFDLRLGETTVEEYVEYVNNVVGQKRGKTNNNALSVVTVRLSNYPDELADWAADFVDRIDQTLHQRSILQNEFLDAIVAKDKSQLLRPPTEIVPTETTVSTTRSQRAQREETQSGSRAEGSSATKESTSHRGLVVSGGSEPEQEPVKTIPRKRPIRRGPTSRFTGFDDYEPPTKTRKLEDTPMEDVQQSEPIQEEITSDVPAFNTQTVQNTRSQAVERSAPSKAQRAKQMEELFPAAAAIKRQREVTRAPSASVEPEERDVKPKPRSNAVDIVAKLQKTKNKMVGKEIDVRDEIRKNLEEQTEKRRLEEENLREALEGVDISEIRGKIQVEEMKLRPREKQPVAENRAKSNRWNPAWDGRKNFKKFRRRGTERGPESQRVLVSFEAAPLKNTNNEMWFDEASIQPNENEHRDHRRSVRVEDSDSEPEAGFTRKKKTRTPEVVHVAASHLEDEGPTSTRGSDRTQRVAETQLDDIQGRGRKRGPGRVPAGQPSGKKSRVARQDDSDSDAEETGFRFRKRSQKSG